VLIVLPQTTSLIACCDGGSAKQDPGLS